MPSLWRGGICEARSSNRSVRQLLSHRNYTLCAIYPYRTESFLTSGAFLNVRHYYLGETVEADVKMILQFVAAFAKITNLITLLPRYMSRSARTAFLCTLADQCPDLQRLCCTRRRDKRDTQCFAYGVSFGLSFGLRTILDE